MGGSKRIHHVDIAQARDLSREPFIVGELSGLETHVLTQRDPARLRLDAIQPVFLEMHLEAAVGFKVLCYRQKREILVMAAFLGPPPVGEQDDPGALLHGPTYGGQGRFDSRGAGDAPVFHGHVQVLTDQHTATREIEVGHA